MDRSQFDDNERTDIGAAIEHEWMRIARNWRKSPRDPRRTLDQSTYVLLALLDDGEPRTLRAISDFLGLEQSTVNRQVNAAIQRRYVARTTPPRGGPGLIEPTNIGRAHFRADLAISLGKVEDVMTAMSPAKIIGLLDGLREFNDVVEARDPSRYLASSPGAGTMGSAPARPGAGGTSAPARFDVAGPLDVCAPDASGVVGGKPSPPNAGSSAGPAVAPEA